MVKLKSVKYESVDLTKKLSDYTRDDLSRVITDLSFQSSLLDYCCVLKYCNDEEKLTSVESNDKVSGKIVTHTFSNLRSHRWSNDKTSTKKEVIIRDGLKYQFKTESRECGTDKLTWLTIEPTNEPDLVKEVEVAQSIRLTLKGVESNDLYLDKSKVFSLTTDTFTDVSDYSNLKYFSYIDGDDSNNEQLIEYLLDVLDLPEIISIDFNWCGNYSKLDHLLLKGLMKEVEVTLVDDQMFFLRPKNGKYNLTLAPYDFIDKEQIDETVKLVTSHPYLINKRKVTIVDYYDTIVNPENLDKKYLTIEQIDKQKIFSSFKFRFSYSSCLYGNVLKFIKKGLI